MHTDPPGGDAPTEGWELVDRVFRCLADADRRAILNVFLEISETEELTVNQVALQAQLPRTCTSRHLRVLRHAGLLTIRRAGTRSWHALRPDGFDGVDDWLLPFVSRGAVLHPLATGRADY
ncbi:ArsR/SmtB family transcription factor [Microbacterium sp. HMH0099]|uniref:ArsR/SmtB family transcription factor n=1 Tax=Microbacterium sp. HMH0099 TaxID=3414026 RepID=UPI003BF67A61